MNENDNLDELAEHIFLNVPGNPCSIELQLEEQTADIAQQQGVADFVFNILYLLTFKGMQILFGHNNINQLTRRDYEYLQKYVNSYGYRLEVYANETTSTPWDILDIGGVLFSYKIGFSRIR